VFRRGTYEHQVLGVPERDSPRNQAGTQSLPETWCWADGRHAGIRPAIVKWLQWGLVNTSLHCGKVALL